MSSDYTDCGPPVVAFRLSYVPGVRFECRPISRTPPDKTVAFLYRREGDNYTQSGVGIVQEGGWVNGKGKPIEGDWLWTAMIDE